MNQRSQLTRFTLRVIVDVVLLSCIAVSLLILHFYVKPSPRGFHCNDGSISYPYQNDTVTFAMCVLVNGCIVFALVLIIETVRWRLYIDERVPGKEQYDSVLIPSIFVSIYAFLGLFLLGAAVNVLMTDVGKYTVGRLRPHYLSLCNPQGVSSLCNDSRGFPTFNYILPSQFTCKPDASNAKHMKDVNKSFPSGHSSYSIYSGLFAVFYLQARFKWRGMVWMLRPFLQVCIMTWSWFVCYSRISDYKHHWSDVLAGSLIGIIIATVTVTIFGRSVFFGKGSLQKDAGTREKMLKSINCGDIGESGDGYGSGRSTELESSSSIP